MSETPLTDKKHGKILGDLGRMRIDGWHEAYHNMQFHAEDLERQLAEARRQLNGMRDNEDALLSQFCQFLVEARKDTERLEFLIKNEYQVVSRGMRYVVWDAHVDPSRCTDSDRTKALIAEDYMARDAIDNAMEDSK